MSSPVVQLRSRVPRIAEAAVEKARLTVVPRRRARSRAGRVPFVALVSLVLLGGVIGLLLFNTSMQQASFAATALEGQARTLAAREQTLQMELEALRNPQHVGVQARRLGMVPPVAPAFLDIETGKVRGEVTVATRAEPLRLWPKPEPLPATLQERTIRVPAEGVLPEQARDRGRDTASGASGTRGASGTDGNRNDQQRQR